MWKSIQRTAPRALVLAVGSAVSLYACGGSRRGGDDAEPEMRGVRPGISVLLSDSIHLIRGRRVGLLTNHTGIDEHGRSSIDLLRSDQRAVLGRVRLVALFSPEHGIRGTEDREQIASGVDERTGLPIHSLYTSTTIAPPDSTLRDLDALVVDLQDIGTRTWTYTGLMLYSLRAAARRGLSIIVVDRPNPITGDHVEGPLLDSALANPEEDAPGRPGRAYALYPAPLRHGMTMGELALLFNDVLGLRAELHVVPMQGWRRAMWFDETKLEWVRPSPNLPSLTSALVYPGLVAFEASNLSVGRGTPEAFQRVGAPWLDARRAVALLEDRPLAGMHFEAERFTPRDPTDRKYGGQEIPGIRIVVTDRNRVQPARIGAALVWAIHRTNPDSLRLNPLAFDLRFGAPRQREALVRGEEPETVIDRELPATIAFAQRSRRYHLYR
jgi:uncharacterized protein YbbC (DUF1343 family)